MPLAISKPLRQQVGWVPNKSYSMSLSMKFPSGSPVAKLSVEKSVVAQVIFARDAADAQPMLLPSRASLAMSAFAAEARANRFQHADARRADEPVRRSGRRHREPAPWHTAIQPDCFHPPHRHVVRQRRAGPILDDHQTCVHGHVRGVVRAEQIAVPVAHLYLPLTRIARSTFRTIVGSAEDVRRVDLVQGDERRLRRMDRLEALTCAESRE